MAVTVADKGVIDFIYKFTYRETNIPSGEIMHLGSAAKILKKVELYNDYESFFKHFTFPESGYAKIVRIKNTVYIITLRYCAIGNTVLFRKDQSDLFSINKKIFNKNNIFVNILFDSGTRIKKMDVRTSKIIRRIMYIPTIGELKRLDKLNGNE